MMFAYWNDYYYIVIILQIIAIIHAIKTGRREWIYLLIFLPAIGAIVYFFMEFLPEMRRGSGSKSLTKALFPHREINEWERKLQVSDSITNKLGLSKAYANQKKYDQAIALTLDCLKGHYDDDPAILLQLSRQYFYSGQYQESIKYFDRFNSKTSIKTAEDELLYARALEGIGNDDAANDDYKRIIRVHHSIEARYYYGLFLKNRKQTEQAKEQFRAIRSELKLLPRYLRKRNAKWLRLAIKESIALK